MPTFPAHDGTVLAYRVSGEGIPVVCLPGGPMQDSVYLGELGGLSARRQLIMVDPRGAGQSGIPADAASYRCDRLVDDVEDLREHLGLDRMDLLAHCAGANVAALYVARHPERVGKLALITPSTMAVGIDATGESRLEIARLRKAIDPFCYGRWDTAAQAHQAAQDGRRNDQAAAAFGAEGAFDADATRAALAAFDAPVLLLAGEVDLNTVPSVVAEFAELFPNAEFIVQPEASHYPWLDDADRFVATTSRYLG